MELKDKTTTTPKKRKFEDDPYKYKHDNEGKNTIVENDKDNATSTKAERRNFDTVITESSSVCQEH
jgi:hypothetical protein